MFNAPVRRLLNVGVDDDDDADDDDDDDADVRLFCRPDSNSGSNQTLKVRP